MIKDKISIIIDYESEGKWAVYIYYISDSQIYNTETVFTSEDPLECEKFAQQEMSYFLNSGKTSDQIEIIASESFTIAYGVIKKVEFNS